MGLRRHTGPSGPLGRPPAPRRWGQSARVSRIPGAYEPASTAGLFHARVERNDPPTHLHLAMIATSPGAATPAEARHTDPRWDGPGGSIPVSAPDAPSSSRFLRIRAARYRSWPISRAQYSRRRVGIAGPGDRIRSGSGPLKLRNPRNRASASADGSHTTSAVLGLWSAWSSSHPSWYPSCPVGVTAYRNGGHSLIGKKLVGARQLVRGRRPAGAVPSGTRGRHTPVLAHQLASVRKFFCCRSVTGFGSTPRAGVPGQNLDQAAKLLFHPMMPEFDLLGCQTQLGGNFRYSAFLDRAEVQHTEAGG